MTNQKTFIEHFLATTGMSAVQAAEALNIHKRTIYRWKSGERNMTTRDIFAMLWVMHDRDVFKK